MENFNRKKWEDLNLSRDEIKSIGEALQKEEFRNLLVEYVKEINDPDNRKQYEAEITQLENERGVDVKFIHPSSGYVIKTIVNGETKAFINICSNDNVGKPSSTPGVDEGHRGLKWSIPYCMAPPREDLDKKNNSCLVYDVVFHPDTLHLAKSNGAFKNLVNNTALDAVEDSFHVCLDRVNLKFPKLTFKGHKQATVIRRKMDNFQEGEYSEIPNYPYPPPKEIINTNDKPSLKKNMKDSEKTKPNFTTPKYEIKYRNKIDMQNYTNDPLTKMAVTVPDELVIEIDLPLLKNCSDASIDVTEKTLNLHSESPAKYKLHLNLPYQVDSNKGNAKFDNVKRVLIVTLPVVKTRAKFSNLVDVAREDSGVESDLNNGRSNSVSSSDDDAADNDHSSSNENQKEKFEQISKPDEYSKCIKRFLKPNIHYIFPNFICHKVKDSLVFTFQVPNVNPDSVEYCFLSKSSGFHMTFLSIGNSFFPSHYAIYVRLPTQIENESFRVEVWDNSVIAQVKLTAIDVQTFQFYVGTDEKNFRIQLLTDSEDNSPEQWKSAEVSSPHSDGNGVIEQVETQTNKISSESQSENQDSKFSDFHEKQNRDEISDYQIGNKDKTLMKEIRDLSISESGASSFDESSSSPTHEKPSKYRTFSESHNEVRHKSRGILKIGRSLSESSVDDYASWNLENGDKPKKTVRFSDVIMKQTFRMNSSILGQRKKNQRKTRNKKRAMERRLSESGGESEGESDVTVINENFQRKDIDVWLQEPESSDVSEVSEVSDVSESDDGQKEDVKPFLPCSSKRNHKRRGKKSARKSAATAKLHFMEN